MEFADIAFQFQFSHSILLGAPVIQMATVQRCSCNVRTSGSEILTHQRMSTVIHWWSKPSSICSSRRVQEHIWRLWLRKKCETTEFREQDLWEVSRENRAAEKGFKSGEIRRELCERVSGTRTDWVSANSHRWDQVWQKCWPTSVLRKITQSVKNNKTYCFSTHNGPFGWCATCKVRNLSSRVDSIDPFSEKPRGQGGERSLPKRQRYWPQKPWWSGLAKCHWGIGYHFVKTRYSESPGVGFLPQVMRNWGSRLRQLFAQGIKVLVRFPNQKSGWSTFKLLSPLSYFRRQSIALASTKLCELVLFDTGDADITGRSNVQRGKNSCPRWLSGTRKTSVYSSDRQPRITIWSEVIIVPFLFGKVGNVPRDSQGLQMVVNTRLELCGAFINRMNVTYVNYTVKGEPKDERKGR